MQTAQGKGANHHPKQVKMANPHEWGNRVHFVVRYLYDTDNNGYLDINDFEALALRYTLQEKRGVYDKANHDKYKKIMIDLWNEIAELADFNKDGQVTVDEFKKAVQNVCVGKSFDQFPQSLKYAITCKFTSADVSGDGVLSIEEYRLECVDRMAFNNIDDIDKDFDKLLNDDDRKKGGLDVKRYQELFAQFIGSPESNVPGVYLFGPLPDLSSQ